ncbi:uncharacterized protein E0L32_004751 [Thyridium curvatum]|uniref:Phospholipase/carboxylesterase/thioesterase domain-containing protein n=1 Tax=Thyridium curvatum TaxID=1093900 RepID=A0A507B5V3_9PEZI|nr:uncharacterized protein E0L32_004751 [Thyridium curvatum]TPX15193.1 hypothetical protein E0L32_004751 [Thyridium curvatum]
MAPSQAYKAYRIPQPGELAALSPSLVVTPHYPPNQDTITAVLILFHGLGDSDSSFASFARGMNLPGVLALTVRGTSPLPPGLFTTASSSSQHFHWGDDLHISPRTGDLDPDPGFAKAADLVLHRLVADLLVGQCSWSAADILLFGYGQGGSLALGLASQVRMPPRVQDITAGEEPSSSSSSSSGTLGTAFRGVVSIGGPLPQSMVPTVSTRSKSETPVLLCHGSRSEAVDEDAVDEIKAEFAKVTVTKWSKPQDSMPSNREEMLPIMQFFAERLRDGWAPGQ